MPTPVTLTIKLDRAGVAPGLRDITADVKKTVAVLQEQFAALNAEMREITFNPRGILAGTDQAVRGVGAVNQAAKAALRSLRDVSAGGGEAGRALTSLGTQAAGAEKRLTALAGSCTAVGTALGDMGAAAGTADVALDSLDAGAAAAQKSVSGLGRAAAGTFTKLDSLSGAAFDPAKIVTGADTATSALERVRLAAAQVQASVRSAGAGGLFLGGRGGASGVPSRESKGLGFVGGMRAGGGMALDMASSVAAVTTLAAAVTGKLSIDFDSKIQQIANSTGAKAGDIKGASLRVGRETGADFMEIANAYRHISDYPNLTKNPGEVEQILRAAVKAAVAQGASPEATAQLLARTMNEYKKRPDHAEATMSTLVQSSKKGDMNLTQYDASAGPVMAMGKANNLQLPDVLSPYIALSQRYNPSQAKTYTIALADKLQHPSNKAMGVAESLKGKTGIDVPSLMTPESFQKLGFVGTLNALAPAIKGNGAVATSLVPSTRGGQALAVLTKSGLPDMNTIYNDPHSGLKATDAGKSNPVAEDYEKQLKQTAQQFKLLKNEITADALEVGAKLAPVFTAGIPVIRELASGVKVLLDGFARLPKPAQEAVLAVGGLKLLSGFLPLMSGFSLLSEKTAATVGGLGKMLLGLGGEAAAGEAGLAGTAEVMSGPFALGTAAVLAAVAGLTVAWKKDWGGIREFTAGLVKQIVSWWRQNMPLIQQTVRTVLSAVERLWHDHGGRIMAVVTPLWNFVKSTVTNAVRVIENVVKLTLDVINGNWRAAGRDLLGIVGSLWAEVKSLFVNGVKAVGNTLALLVSAVYDIGKRLLTAALHVGESVVGGMVQGIRSKVSEVAGAARDMALSAITSATTVLDIHSPSRVMHKVGEQTARGMADGILAGVPGVTAAMRRMTAAALAEADPVKARLMIRNDARGLEAGGMKKTAVAGWRDASLTGITERTAGARKQSAVEAHQFDHFFDSQQGGDTHLHAKWENRLADNASYKAYLDARKQQLQEWGAAHKAWLDAHEAGAKRFQTIEGRIDTAMQQVSGRVQRAQDGLDKAAQAAKTKADAINRDINDQLGAMDDEGPDRFSRRRARNVEAYQKEINAPGVDANAAGVLYQRNDDAITADQATATNEAGDKMVDWQAQHGEMSLPNALDYFRKRQGALETAGQSYTSEWYEIAQKVDDIQRQITDAERQAADTEGQSLRARFDALKESFQDGKVSIDAYKASLQALQQEIATYDAANPASAPALEPLRHEVTDAGIGADKKEKKESGAILVGGQPFWDGLASSAAEQGSRVLDALFNPREKKSIFKSMWSDLMQSAEGSLKGGLSAILKNLITGAGGKLSLGGLLGGLFGGKKTGGGANGGGAGVTSLSDMIASAAGGGATVKASALGSFDAQGLYAAAGGMGTDPGMGGAGGGSSPLGLLGMLGRGGVGGLFSHGGLFTGSGALGGFGAALPWIGGGLALNGILGNPLGKALKGIRKLLHFEHGGRPPLGQISMGGERGIEGFLPDTGRLSLLGAGGPTLFTPTVPGTIIPHGALADAFTPRVPSLPSLAPGYAGGADVSPSGQITPGRGGRPSGGDTHITIHDHGDKHLHSEADFDDFASKLAKKMERQRRAGVPASF